MPTTALDKVRREAKKIQARTGKSYQAALKQAGREYKHGKVAGRHKKKKPAKKVAGKQKYVVHHVVEKVGKLRYANGEYKIGALTIPQARAQVEQKLAWELLAKDSAKRVKERKEAAKKIKALKALDKRLKSI
jgi:transposase